VSDTGPIATILKVKTGERYRPHGPLVDRLSFFSTHISI